MNIEGVAAIITGGASGLGEGTAERLAAKGAKVTILDLNEDMGRHLGSGGGERQGAHPGELRWDRAAGESDRP
jgi:NAD(P)-dependent dehydrogenase (short-subunit alcohol dehydrogenase family)